MIAGLICPHDNVPNRVFLHLDNLPFPTGELISSGPVRPVQYPDPVTYVKFHYFIYPIGELPCNI